MDDNDLQAEQELLVFTPSDEALEKAAGGLSGAQTYPGTGVATICVPDTFPKESLDAAQPLTRDEARWMR